MRDLAPFTTDIYRARMAGSPGRTIPAGAGSPRSIMRPARTACATPPARALRLRPAPRDSASISTRGWSACTSTRRAQVPPQGDLELGVSKQEFVNRTIKERTYPADDGPWDFTGPAVRPPHREPDAGRPGCQPTADARRLEPLCIEDRHGATQFQGDPSDLVPARPYSTAMCWRCCLSR